MDYRTEAPIPVRDFLVYHETIKGQSKATVDSYYMDLRTFTRYLYIARSLVKRDTPMEEIDIRNADVGFYRKVTLSEVYEFLAYLSRDRELIASSRARMITSIKGLFYYLTVKTNQMDENPVENLDAPKLKKSLPHYLSLSESQRLLSAVSGKNKERDYCILTLFLNCGLRISELVRLNLSDIHGNSLIIHGKGSKERIIYLNDACQKALDDWMNKRNMIELIDKNAVFISTRRTRMSVDSIQLMVRNSLIKAGLDPTLYSPHKLRHTAATLMLQNGVDIRTLQEVLGHENLNTTQIYTHIGTPELKKAIYANPLAKFYPDKEA